MNKKNPYRTKMKPDELREYLAFKRKQGCVPAKKGKGSYNRKKLNNEKEWQEMKIKIEYVVNHSGIYEIPGGLRNEDEIFDWIHEHINPPLCEFEDEILDEELDIGIEIF